MSSVVILVELLEVPRWLFFPSWNSFFSWLFGHLAPEDFFLPLLAVPLLSLLWGLKLAASILAFPGMGSILILLLPQSSSLLWKVSLCPMISAFLIHWRFPNLFLHLKSLYANTHQYLAYSRYLSISTWRTRSPQNPISPWSNSPSFLKPLSTSAPTPVFPILAKGTVIDLVKPET